MFIPDPNNFHPGSRVTNIPGAWIRIRIKELKYFNPKICFNALGNMIRDVHPGFGSWYLTHSGSRIQGSKRHWIPDPDSKHCLVGCLSWFYKPVCVPRYLPVHDLYKSAKLLFSPWVMPACIGQLPSLYQAGGVGTASGRSYFNIFTIWRDLRGRELEQLILLLFETSTWLPQCMALYTPQGAKAQM